MSEEKQKKTMVSYSFKHKTDKSKYEHVIAPYAEGDGPAKAVLRERGLDPDDYEITFAMGIGEYDGKVISDRHERYDGDVLITDPCYLHDGAEDPDGCTVGCHSFSPCLSGSTIYGDWSCTVFDKDYKPIGEFCADSGQYCVIPYGPAKAKLPRLEEWVKKHYWCAAVVKDFHGEIHAIVSDAGKDPDTGESYGDEVHIEGRDDDGNVVFFTRQTGL